MGKQQRHNTETIANVLIDKLSDMEKTASRIEKASQQPLKIDTREIQQILADKEQQEKDILRLLRGLQEKNRTRLPNWVLVVLSAVFFASIGLSLYAWNKAEEYDQQKAKADHFERLFIESQKEKD